MCVLFLFPFTVQYVEECKCFPPAESVAVQCCGIHLSREHWERSFKSLEAEEKIKVNVSCVGQMKCWIKKEWKDYFYSTLLEGSEKESFLLKERIKLLHNFYRSNIHTSPPERSQHWEQDLASCNPNNGTKILVKIWIYAKLCFQPFQEDS